MGRSSIGDQLAILQGGLKQIGDSLGASDRGARPAFRRIFELNNEIGRLAKARPDLRSDLVELQSAVNSVTVALKSGDKERAARALEESVRGLESLMNRERAPQKNL